MPPGYGYLTHHLPQKVTRARISDSATDEQVLTHEMRGKKTQLYNPTMKMFRPQRPQKTYAYLKQIVPAGSDIGRGRSSTLGVVSTLGRIWPSLKRRHGRKDLNLKGGSQRRAWALDDRVKPLDLG
jgi:muramidase (phage lysozyme)